MFKKSLFWLTTDLIFCLNKSKINLYRLRIFFDIFIKNFASLSLGNMTEYKAIMTSDYDWAKMRNQRVSLRHFAPPKSKYC